MYHDAGLRSRVGAVEVNLRNDLERFHDLDTALCS